MYMPQFEGLIDARVPSFTILLFFVDGAPELQSANYPNRSAQRRFQNMCAICSLKNIVHLPARHLHSFLSEESYPKRLVCQEKCFLVHGGIEFMSSWSQDLASDILDQGPLCVCWWEEALILAKPAGLGIWSDCNEECVSAVRKNICLQRFSKQPEA